MLIKQIMDDDTSNCQQALEEDAKLKNLEEKLYTILSNCPEDTFLDLEKTVTEYMARVVRIAYLQGIKDFAELFITLKKDIHEILQNHL